MTSNTDGIAEKDWFQWVDTHIKNLTKPYYQCRMNTCRSMIAKAKLQVASEKLLMLPLVEDAMASEGIMQFGVRASLVLLGFGSKHAHSHDACEWSILDLLLRCTYLVQGSERIQDNLARQV